MKNKLVKYRFLKKGWTHLKKNHFTILSFYPSSEVCKVPHIVLFCELAFLLTSRTSCFFPCLLQLSLGAIYFFSSASLRCSSHALRAGPWSVYCMHDVCSKELGQLHYRVMFCSCNILIAFFKFLHSFFSL